MSRRHSLKLNKRLNLGKRLVEKNKFIETKDRHSKLLPTEVNLEELCLIFFCTYLTLAGYIKIAQIKPARMAKQMKAFDRKTTIEILNNYAADGKLTFDKKRLASKSKVATVDK